MYVPHKDKETTRLSMCKILREDMSWIGWKWRWCSTYFKQLFNTPSPSFATIECINSVKKKVKPDMNEKLQQPFTCEEVHEALKQMAPLKAPGPDDFNACFY